jgi:hypothetical protein
LLLAEFSKEHKNRFVCVKTKEVETATSIKQQKQQQQNNNNSNNKIPFM